MQKGREHYIHLVTLYRGTLCAVSSIIRTGRVTDRSLGMLHQGLAISDCQQQLANCLGNTALSLVARDWQSIAHHSQGLCDMTLD